MEAVSALPGSVTQFLDEDALLRAFLQRVQQQVARSQEDRTSPGYNLADVCVQEPTGRDSSIEVPHLQLTAEELHAIATLEIEHLQNLLDQAEDDHERALTESEAKLADIEARVSSSNACLLHLKREVTPEAALHGDILSMERVLRHLEHNIDGKGAAVDKFTVQAATLKAKLKSGHQQRQHQKDQGEGLHAVDFDQLNIQNQQLVAELSKCSATLLQAKRTSASLLQALAEEKTLLMKTMDESSRLASGVAACGIDKTCV